MNTLGAKCSAAAASSRLRPSLTTPIPSRRGAAPPFLSLPPPSLLHPLHRLHLLLPPVCSQDRQRHSPTEGNLSAGRPPRNKPGEPPTKLNLRGNNGSGGASSGSRLPPHVPHLKQRTHPEAEEAAEIAAGASSTDLQFLTALVSELESGAARRAGEVASAAEGDFETAFYRRRMALAASNEGAGGNTSHLIDPKHFKKALIDAAELRRGQLRELRHAVRGDIQALVKEGKASKGEAARADAAVEAAFRTSGAALEGAAASAMERAAKLAG